MRADVRRLPALAMRSFPGRIAAGCRGTFVTITSCTGPRAEARELIARRAGTSVTARPALRAARAEYRATISGALEFDSTTYAPRWHASRRPLHVRRL